MISEGSLSLERAPARQKPEHNSLRTLMVFFEINVEGLGVTAAGVKEPLVCHVLNFKGKYHSIHIPFVFLGTSLGLFTFWQSKAMKSIEKRYEDSRMKETLLFSLEDP